MPYDHAVLLAVEPHPLLEVGAFVARLAQPLGEIAGGVGPDAPSPLELIASGAETERVKLAVRDLLRHGGFKPAGRSKPASEYLAGALAEGRYPRINALVDACNLVSLRSGLPISLVDADQLTGDLRIAIAAAGTTYPFNPTGQVIDAGGLVCLYDALGPTGTPVKDAQRTKTCDTTRAALAIVWGTRALPGRTEAATRWFRELAATCAVVEDVTLA